MPRRPRDVPPTTCSWPTCAPGGRRTRGSTPCPAYVVAHDALLAAIVEQRPGSIAALRRVKGMGPTKLERYGEEILAILARR